MSISENNTLGASAEHNTGHNNKEIVNLMLSFHITTFKKWEVLIYVSLQVSV